MLTLTPLGMVDRDWTTGVAKEVVCRVCDRPGEHELCGVLDGERHAAAVEPICPSCIEWARIPRCPICGKPWEHCECPEVPNRMAGDA